MALERYVVDAVLLEKRAVGEVGVRKRQSWQQSHRHGRKSEAGITTPESAFRHGPPPHEATGARSSGSVGRLPPSSPATARFVTSVDARRISVVQRHL
jgi:hypothetical protein